MIRALVVLGLALLLLGPSAAVAAITVVQATSCSSHPATSCTTPALTTTTGNLFVVSGAYCCSSGGITSITDSKTNTYGTTIAETNQGAGYTIQYHVAAGTGGGSHTFTSNNSGGGIYASISVVEVSGAAASPLDKTATGTDLTGTSHTSANTATTAQANELLIGYGSSPDITTYTTDTGAGWTERANIATDANTEGLLCGSKVVAATGAYAYTWTSSASVRTLSGISTWKEAVAAAGVRQQCIGCGADRKVVGE